VQGRSDMARALLELALGVAVDGGERAYELGVRSLLAQLCAEGGRLPDARRHLVEAGAIAASGQEWRGLAAQLYQAQGGVDISQGRLDEAEVHFLRSIDTYRRYTYPWGEAEVQLAWARGLRNAGQAASAADRLSCAEAIYRRSGAGEAWLQRLESERGVEHPSAYPNGLSEREVEVLRLVVAGLTNRQIGDALVISLNTVARHVSNIFAKTGVANRAEAASFAHRHGLIAAR
jgi:DNA-binding CsgD family transcriptional regulator